MKIVKNIIVSYATVVTIIALLPAFLITNDVSIVDTFLSSIKD
ncbi:MULTISPECIES: hypothetical protein [Anoxybacillus]|uniref:Uncharacterized protein n=1 Tax=Anoxybacillus ayderensis TaxID=265546 RepID=A0A0D0G5M0_9BACL|nr:MULTISPECIES: hypothetical protein [Anoxybacillus]KHF27584.1 hypothetical protein LR68_03624 [Anoxybacillus sp. BCO1]EPZ39416.1 hypothetical protein C289_0614 [Anoxybacillus ayderensis]KIP20685.1 hypothetical protein JV16_02141 [Anoxybacillus ayderensis]MBA2878262.1 hypothetical protein [Anoxybacillus ayderensis]MED0657318.1 hypothetical protein [Anoxybacillus ayderensis]